MRILPRIRQLLFLAVLATVLAPVPVEVAEYYEMPCPPDHCSIWESCPGPTGLYWQWYTGSCSSPECGCSLEEACTYGGAGYLMCKCTECGE